MIQFFKTYKKFWILLFCICSVIIYLFYNALKPKIRLPIYQPFDIDVTLVDSNIQHIKKYHKVKDFNLFNQNGEVITHRFYDNKIYVVDFFFTTCMGICPVLTNSMKKIQDHFINDNQILLASFSVTPKTDTPKVLKAYAREKNVVDSKWNLLTGDKKQIYKLARTSYFVVKEIKDNTSDMIHTENVVLIDKNKRIRGFYDGTNEKEVEQLIKDIVILKAD